MSHLTPEQRDMLQVWSEYGERPFDGIIEMGKPAEFLQMLYQNRVFGPFFRGTLRHGELEIGDIFEYTYPTSWSYEEETAKNFIEGLFPATLLIIPESELAGVENTENSHREQEAILAPFKLTVLDKSEENGVVILTLG